MLGDLYITKYGRLQTHHSSYDYTKWKFDFLLRFNVVSKQTKISTVHQIHKQTKKPSREKPPVALLIFKQSLNISKGPRGISYRFYSKSCFLQCRNVFYKEIKQITVENKKRNRKILPFVFCVAKQRTPWPFALQSNGGLVPAK